MNGVYQLIGDSSKLWWVKDKDMVFYNRFFSAYTDPFNPLKLKVCHYLCGTELWRWK